uniref:Uncharacterized protein n=1 Tax=Arundo donax TaxID=35708 RepID=A0A0A9GD14_ARUDO
MVAHGPRLGCAAGRQGGLATARQRPWRRRFIGGVLAQTSMDPAQPPTVWLDLQLSCWWPAVATTVDDSQRWHKDEQIRRGSPPSSSPPPGGTPALGRCHQEDLRSHSHRHREDLRPQARLHRDAIYLQGAWLLDTTSPMCHPRPPPSGARLEFLLASL